MLPGETRARLSADLVRRGLPHRVGVGIRYASADEAPPLHASEEALLGTRAVERRRLSFALGRAAARDALAELGVDDAGVGRGAAGEPLWPPGIVGAISHAGDVAVGLVGRADEYLGLGVDVEELSRGPSTRTARLVCRPNEMDWVDVESGTQRLMMLFSAKEAVFKAVYPIERIWLGFGDAELTWRGERGMFEARLLKSPGTALPVGAVLDVYCTVTTTQVLSTTFRLLAG
jgi:4'-phosphopantetheinyl transferase EntD